MHPARQLKELIRRLDSLAESFEKAAQEDHNVRLSMESAAKAYRHAAAIARGPVAEANYSDAEWAKTRAITRECIGQVAHAAQPIAVGGA
jgi:hypothetical protein